MKKEKIIEYIKESKSAEIATLQKKFDVSYRDVKSIIDELVSQGTLEYADGVRYNYVVPQPANDSRDKNSEMWKEMMARRRSIIEERRQEYLKRMREKQEEDDDDDDDDPFEAFLDDEADIEPKLLKAMRNFKVGMNAYADENRVFIAPLELLFYGYMKNFELIMSDGKVFITDQGATISKLRERINLDTEGVEAEIEKICNHYELTRVDSEMRIEVPYSEKAVACFLRLFAAIEAIRNLDEEAISGSIEREKSDARCRQIIAQLLEEDKDIDCKATMSRIRDKWDEAQKADDLETVHDCVNAVRALVALGDDGFALLRERLLNDKEKSEGSGQDDEKDDAQTSADLTAANDAEEPLREEHISLKFALGQDDANQPIYGELAKLKHFFIGGTQQFDKTIFLHSMITDLISRYSPEEIRLILVDSQGAEFMLYNELPHLLTGEIVENEEQFVNALSWAIREMEDRYSLFQKKTKEGTRVWSIEDYMKNRKKGEANLPRILIVVNELADFMGTAKEDIQERLMRLMQKSRAAGIHVALATRHPSENVVTDIVKGHASTRIALRCATELDSEAILDEEGAERLLRIGDMLIKLEGNFDYIPAHCSFISDEAVLNFVEAAQKIYKARFDYKAREYIRHGHKAESEEDKPVDPLYLKALALVIKLGQVSLSMLQRKCCIGYNIAGRIMEWMEKMGYISAFDGSRKARKVLITKEEYEAKYGPLD